MNLYAYALAYANAFLSFLSSAWERQKKESRANIWRGWIVPVGGSTPDRQKLDFEVGRT